MKSLDEIARLRSRLAEKISLHGGYDEGYSRCPCFWGKSPGSLVRRVISDMSSAQGRQVLDLGCGEGKMHVHLRAQARAFSPWIAPNLQ